MMGRKDDQMQIIVLDMEELVPNKHLLRKIDELVWFDFKYDMAEPFYSGAVHWASLTIAAYV